MFVPNLYQNLDSQQAEALDARILQAGLDSGFRATADWHMLAEPVQVSRAALKQLGQDLQRCLDSAVLLSRMLFPTPDAFYRYCGIAEEKLPFLAALAEVGEPFFYPKRWDVIPGIDGPMKAVEVNIGLAIAGINQRSIQQVYDSVPTVSPAWTDTSGFYVRRVAEWAQRHPGRRLVVCDCDAWFDDDLNFLQSLQHLLQSQNIEAELVRMSDWEAFAEDDRYGLIEVFNALDFTSMQQVERYLRYQRRVGQVFCSPAQMLWSSKAIFALLWQGVQDGVLGDEAVTAIRRAIPFTRILQASERDAVLARRAELVIKPATGLGGDRVTVGAAVSDAEWMAEVDAGLASADVFVMQDFYPPASLPFTRLVEGQRFPRTESQLILGIFQMDQAYAGGFARASTRSGAINVMRGAGLGVMREV